MAIQSIEQKQSIFRRSKLVMVVVIIMLFTAGQLVRLKDLTDSPVDMLPEEQVQFLLAVQGQAARDPSLPVLDYSAGTPDAPLLQMVDSLLANLTGVSPLGISRMVSLLGWLAAAVLVFMLLCRVSGIDAAVIGSAMFLFMPFTIQISRTVLPASWVTAFLAGGLLCLVYWTRDNSWLAALGFALSTSLAAVLDPAGLYLSLGVLLGIFFAMRKGFSRKQWLQFGFMIACVILMRAGSVILHNPDGSLSSAVLGFSGSLSSLLSLKKLSRLELRIESIIGILGIVFSLFGLLLAQKGLKRSVMTGLWIGFALYCALQLNAISLSFYPLYPLMLLVVLSFVPLIDLAVPYFTGLGRQNLVLAGICVILVGGMALGSLGGRKLASTSAADTLPETWQAAGLRLGQDAVILTDSREYSLMTAFYGGVIPLCLPGDGVCSQPLSQLVEQNADRPLYYLTSAGSLEQDQTLEDLLAGYPLRCEIGSRLVIVPLTDIHPACSESVQ